MEKILHVYDYVIEGEYGAMMGYYEAENLRAALAMLKEDHPRDIGADGVWYLEDGVEVAINW